MNSPENIQNAIQDCVNFAKGMHGGAEAMRRILLPLYNPFRWHLDMTQLRRIDTKYAEMALMLIHEFTWGALHKEEIHLWIPTGEQDFGYFWDLEKNESIFQALGR